ncbi:hypothetical protein [Nocardioides sp. TF02-7]|uniref:hypothetical protein n=1 Tax=Nocardioides sp. TF02-7 TaxID=2917724 RepID=UPI001F064E68|nr:hypothetical protein [Nocardioides sp. TF02-7]UMG93995.1 hypothetical protein MF408_07905 [Nocardioides sp. TF02-7]
MTLPDPLQGIPALPSGDDFEAFVWSLLQRRYPPENLRYFPAAMGGDKGLEGFSTDGIGYQCYADKDSLTLRARTDKQKAKLTRDTSKLKKNKDALVALLDGTVLDHYFLIVPEYHSTEVIAHANKRAQLVRSWGLPFISDKFAIAPKTPQDYQGQYQAALLDAAAQVLLAEPTVSDAAVDGFGGKEPALATTLLEKVGTPQGPSPRRRCGRHARLAHTLVPRQGRNDGSPAGHAANPRIRRGAATPAPRSAGVRERICRHPAAQPSHAGGG